MPPEQLELFADHVARLQPARRALAEFEIEAAAQAFDEVLALWPAHAGARASLTRVRELQRMLDARMSGGVSIAEALLSIAEEVAGSLGPGIYRRIAREIERSSGRGASLRAEPAGLYYRLGDDPVECEASLRATLAARPRDARARGYLADALFARGERDTARTEWLRAFVDDARSVALERVADPAVASLVALAEDFEVTGDPVTWVAPVGVVTGVFALEPDLVGIDAGADDRIERDDPAHRFYRALLEERRCRTVDERIPSRRTMRSLCPALLARYLGRDNG